MKILLPFICFPIFIFAQVGINTTNPQAMLDVEGDLRISLLSGGSDLAARDSILVVDGNNVVRLIAAKDVLNNTEKTLIRGSISSGSSVAVNGLIPFSTIDFDLKGEFNTTTYEFTAIEAGIYRADVQVTMGAISVGESGVGIYKVDLLNTETLIAQERYLNINVLGITVNPPTRSTSTLIQLEAGEKIRFKNSGLLVISLLNNPAGTFFSIEQVR